MNLSYSSLQTKKDCPRCFYLDKKFGIKRPEGIKSGVPTAVDGILKDGFEIYRGKLPPDLASESRLKGFVLYADPELKKMRHWNSNPTNYLLPDGSKFISAFDDLLYNPTTKQFAYLDYKSTGKEPNQEFGEKYYQGQCDLYTQALVMRKNLVADFGVLFFFWPEPDGKGGVTFKEKTIFLKPNPKAGAEALKEACALLGQTKIPPASDSCVYCAHSKQSGAVK